MSFPSYTLMDQHRYAAHRRHMYPIVVLVVLLTFTYVTWDSAKSTISRTWIPAYAGRAKGRGYTEATLLLNMVVGGGSIPQGVDVTRPLRAPAYRAEALDINEDEFRIVVFCMTDHGPSKGVKHLLEGYDIQPPAHFVDLDTRGDGDLIAAILNRLTGRKDVPMVFISGVYVGGMMEMKELHESGKLVEVLADGKRAYLFLSHQMT